jgi:hypothetical protein
MMGFSENTLKKLKDAVRSVQEKTEGKEEAVQDVCSATGKVVLQAAAHRLITNRLAEKAQEAVQTAATPTFGSVAEHLLLGNLRVLNLGFRLNAIEELADAIDRLLEEPETEEEPIPEEEPVEEESEEAPVTEEPAVETFATVEEPVAEVENEENESDEDSEDDENEDDSLAGIDTEGLEFIDVMAEPERYAEMQEQERQGLVRLVSRYRRSFLSRLSQSRGNVQEYYSVIKNAFLSYKGVKGRVSWGYESFNRGRVKLAKVNAKSSTLYVYLALDPATLEGTKYFFTDVSSKKKYAATPVLLKIKGERKLKHALELIEKLCAEQNALPPVKDYETVDYTIAEQTTEELVQAGLIRQFTAAVPVGAFETGVVFGE